MRKFLVLLVVGLLATTFAFAQREVKGTVIDAQGTPISGASVTLVGTNKGTSTDGSGNFSLIVPNNGRIVVSAVGQQEQTVSTGTGSTITVVMKPSATNELSTVVVTALNIQRQPQELGYATAKVKAAELTQAKTVNVANGLTGKVSGLNIQTVNNGVFGDVRITLRGIRSLTGNNQPMLVVDGVPISLNYLSSINPNDIQDVSILKSSSSTAIYGPEGVNGAIVISTKRGYKARPQFSISHTTQFEQVTFMPLFQNQFGSGSSEDANGQGVYDPIENQQYGDAFDGSIREVGRVFPDGNFAKYAYSALPNEKKKFWNVGVTNQTDLSFSAGTFYMSAQQVDIQGITPKDENKRTAVTLGASNEYNRLKASYQVRYTKQKFDVASSPGRDENAYWNLVNTPAQIPISQYKNWKSDYFANPNGYYNDYYDNPYFIIDTYRNRGTTDDIFGSAQLDYKFNSWLSATYRLGNTFSNNNNKSITNEYKYSAYAKGIGKTNAQTGDVVASVGDNINQSNRLSSELYLTGQKKFKNFKIDGILGQSFREITTKSISVSAPQLGIPTVFNTSVIQGNVVGSEGNSKQRLQRFFGKIGLGYKGFLFGEVTASYDQDSRLANPADFRVKDYSFFYPSASLSFVATEAFPSIKSKTLSFLKFSASAAKTGNVNVGTYSLENTLSPQGDFPYGDLLGFSASNVLRQPTYQPEFVQNREVGMEVGLNDNKINFEVSAYRQRNTNQVITAQLSSTTGYTSALVNAADFTNEGLELDLKLTPIVKLGDFSVDLKVNYTRQQNLVNSIADNLGLDELGVGNLLFVTKGQSAYSFKTTDYERDSLGRVKIFSNGLPRQATAAARFGTNLPKNLVGISLNVNWRQLSLSVVADHRSGNQIYNDIGTALDFAGLSVRSAQNGRQPFLFPNSSIDDGTGKFVPNNSVYTTGGYNFWSQAINTGVQSNYLVSAAFWKIREVAMTYAFPADLFKGRGLKGMTASITARNLVTWLPKTNQWTDPEFANTTGNAIGVNNIFNTPPTRLFGANITLNF